VRLLFVLLYWDEHKQNKQTKTQTKYEFLLGIKGVWRYQRVIVASLYCTSGSLKRLSYSCLLAFIFPLSANTYRVKMHTWGERYDQHKKKDTGRRKTEQTNKKQTKYEFLLGIKRVWRYQRSNQNSHTDEEQTTQWPNRSTKGQTKDACHFTHIFS
jgi:hypothetical protein